MCTIFIFQINFTNFYFQRLYYLKISLIFVGTPLPYVNREKLSFGDSIKKHILHKALTKTPKPSSNTPSTSSSAAKITKTPLASVSCLSACLISNRNNLLIFLIYR